MSISEFEKVREFVRKHQFHSEGLYVAFAAYFVMLRGAYKVIPYPQDYLGAIFLAGCTILFCGWLLSRRIPRFGDGTIGVIFAPNSDPELESELDRLRLDLVAGLKQSKFSKAFVVRSLPTNHNILDLETARQIRSKSRCLLLIWGEYRKGNAHSKERRGFPLGKLNFTYAIPTGQKTDEISKDIRKGLQDRKWDYESHNDYFERDVVSKNIVGVSKYIIGTCLGMFGEMAAGRQILREALATGGAWKASSPKVVQEFVTNVNGKIGFVDFLEAQAIYQSKIFRSGRLTIDKDALSAIIAKSDSSISLSRMPNGYLQKAIAQLLLGDLNGAKRTIGRFKTFWPADSAGYFSMAFLNMYSGEYGEGLRQYKKALNKAMQVTPSFGIHLTEFPEAILELEPDKIQMHFVLGLLLAEFGDPIRAKAHYANFVGKANGNSILTILVAHAKEKVEELEALEASANNLPGAT